MQDKQNLGMKVPMNLGAIKVLKAMFPKLKMQ